MVLYPNRPTQRHSHLIIGASRGIGLEFTRQLLLEHDQHVIATARNINAPELRALQAQSEEQKKGTLMIVECDVTDEESIQRMAEYVGSLVKGARLRGRTIENVIVNAGILEYPNRVLGRRVDDFSSHVAGTLSCSYKSLFFCFLVYPEISSFQISAKIPQSLSVLLRSLYP
jgi:NAD(P)-dependent dehydrogenase (short-subunit alcohol dehydrogenase family)